MEYVVTAIFLVIGLVTLGLLLHVREETKHEPRPSLLAASRMMTRSRLAVLSVASGECPCGGILGPSGTVSPRYGQLLACTGCRRYWTSDGRRVIRRAVRPGRRPRPQS